MAKGNSGTITNAEYPVDSRGYSILTSKNANIDANYGPWESTDAYEQWLSRKGINTPLEGTLIAIKTTESDDVQLKVYSKGSWKDVGTGGTGGNSNLDFEVKDSGEYVANDDKFVSVYPNQGLSDNEKTYARNNIGAVDVNAVRDIMAPCSKRISDETLGGHKLFSGQVTIGSEPVTGQSHYTTTLNHDTVINGNLKYTRKNAGKNTIEAGVLMRDNQGNVYSSSEISSSGDRVAYADNAAQADTAARATRADNDGNGNNISTTYLKLSNLGNIPLGDFQNDEGFLNNIKIEQDSNVCTLYGKTPTGEWTAFANGTFTIPVASAVASGTYDSTTNKLLITLSNDDVVEISVDDLVDGLQTKITDENGKISADIIKGLAPVARNGEYTSLRNAPQFDDNNESPSTLTNIYSSAYINNAFLRKADLKNVSVKTNSSGQKQLEITRQKTPNDTKETIDLAVIDDGSRSSAYKTWSINKLNDVFATKNELPVDASSAIKTLKFEKSGNKYVISGATVGHDNADITGEIEIATADISGRYDNSSHQLILTINNQDLDPINLGDLVSGLQHQINRENHISADYIDGLADVAKNGNYSSLDNRPAISTSNDNTTISSDSTTVNGTFTAKGNVNLGTDTGQKTINLGAYSESNPLNALDIVNVNGSLNVIGSTQLGDGNGNYETTVKSALKLDKAGNKGGVLKTDTDGTVSADPGIFMKFGGELNTYGDLPSNGVEVGDTRYIKDKDSFVIASEVTNDNNLYIRIPGVNLITLNVHGTNPTHPRVSYADVKEDLYRVHTVFADYPLIDYYYHSLPAGGDGKLRVIPIDTDEYGIIVVLASEQKIFVVTNQDNGGPVNSWYCEGLDNTGEVKDITSALPEGDNDIRQFTLFGGGVVWTGTKDDSNKGQTLIYGYPGHEGGAQTVTYNLVDNAVTNTEGNLGNFFLKYVDTEHPSGLAVYMNFTGRNAAGNYTFSASQYDYNELKAFMYCAEVTDTDICNMYVVELTGTLATNS